MISQGYRALRMVIALFTRSIAGISAISTCYIWSRMILRDVGGILIRRCRQLISLGKGMIHGGFEQQCMEVESNGKGEGLWFSCRCYNQIKIFMYDLAELFVCCSHWILLRLAIASSDISITPYQILQLILKDKQGSKSKQLQGDDFLMNIMDQRLIST